MIISQYQQNAIDFAILQLQNQKVIAIPTDTVYGLAVDASSFEGVEKIYELKKRDNQKPIAIFVQNLTMAKEIFQFNQLAERIANLYMPGKITMILNVKENHFNLAKNLNYNNSTIGFRYVNSFFMAKLLEIYQKPLAVTSANISGGTATNSPSTTITGTAPTTLVTYRPPSTTFLSNSWGTPTIAATTA